MAYVAQPVANPLGAKRGGDLDNDTYVAHALRAEGFDAGEDGTGRGTPLVATTLRARDGAKGVDSDCTDTLVAIPLLEIGKGSSCAPNGIGIGQNGDPMFTLQAGAQHGVAVGVDLQNCAMGGDVAGTLDTTRPTRGGGQAVRAFDARQSDVIQYGDRSGPLDTDGHTVAVAFQTRGSNVDLGQDVTGTIGSNADRASGSAPCLAVAAAVRRLTPVECSRLQGFSDDYLDITFRGRPAADGNKYRALGNSMAVPCMAWIGRRIAAQEAEAQRKQEAA